MIVSYEGVRGGLLLREVKTEEEAFTEMRRFLEVNRIPSVYTEVRWQDADERMGHLARHKRIYMGCKVDNGVTFGIYYDGQPRHLELGSEKEWGIKRELFTYKNFSYHYRSTVNGRVCWYDDVMTYLKDLAERKAGGG